jgi:hypothetical protein
MDFEDKVLWGGIISLIVCLFLFQLGMLNEATTLLVAGVWVVWLSLHNRVTRTMAISSLIGLLGSVAFGVPIGLLLFVLSLVAFWYAWI